jgi:hypothetical protein
MRTIGQLKEDLHVDDMRVITEQIRMVKHYGYCPALASNLPDFSIASQQVDFLLKEFPGYRWIVSVQDKLLLCVNETLQVDYGFKFPVTMFDVDGRFIRKGGAQLLEMYGVQTKYSIDHIADAKKDLRGNILRC